MMDNKINRLRENYQRKTLGNLAFPGNTKDSQPPRRVSHSIKKIVKVYEDQLDEYEKNRTNQNLLSLRKKYNISRTDPKINGENCEKFMNELEQLLTNMENEIELLKKLKKEGECDSCKGLKDIIVDKEEEIHNLQVIITKMENDLNEYNSVHAKEKITYDDKEKKYQLMIDTLKRSVTEKENIIAKKQELANKFEVELKTVKDIDLAMRNKEIMDKEIKISIQDEKINELENKIKVLGDKENEIYKQSSKINELELKLMTMTDKDGKIKKQEDKINELQQKLIKMTEIDIELAHKNEKIKELETKISKLNEKDSEILKLREKVSNLEQKVTQENKSTLDEYVMVEAENETKIKNLEEQIFILKKHEVETNHIIEELESEKEYLGRKYDDLSVHITTMIEDITKPESILAQYDGNIDYIIPKILNDKNNWLVDLLVDNLFNEYKLATSVSITSLNNHIISNFNLYLNTIFLKEGNFLSLSIVHEYLQDIFLKIYQSHLDDLDMIKLNQIKLNKYNYIVSNEDLKNKDYSKVIEDLLNFNPLNNLYENDFNIENKVDSLINKLNMIKNQDEYKTEVINKLIKKIESYNEISKNDIKKIIDLGLQYIHASKIVNRFYEIYDFSKLFYSHNSLIVDDKSVCYYQSIDAPSTVENLLTLLKYSGNSSDNIRIQGNIEIGNIFKFPLSDVLKKIIFLKNLKSLTINDTNLIKNEEDIIYIQKTIELTGLTILNLANNYIGDEGTRRLMEALKYNNTIKTLDVSFNNITATGGCYLAEMLNRNTSLTKLILSGNNITGNGIHLLINSLLEKNKTLKHLDLSINRLITNDILYIGNMITKNNLLEVLNLSNNTFDLHSINNIGLSLKENRNLKKLYMNYVNIDEDTAPYMLQHLSESHIEELHLDGNNLGQAGGILFANVLKSNKFITKLSIKGTSLNSAALECISLALEHNNKKKLIELNDNDFSDETIMMLYNTIKNTEIEIGLTLKCGSLRGLLSNCKNFIL